MARRGYSIIEVLVAAAVAALAFTLLLYLFGQSRTSVATSQAKSGVLQQGRLLLEYLKRDLRAIRVDPAHPDAACETGPGRCDLTRESTGGGDGERVTYRYDAASGRVTRESAGAPVEFGRDGVRVRAFAVKADTRRVAGVENRLFRVTLRLSDANDEPRSRLSLETTVAPPALGRSGPDAW